MFKSVNVLSNCLFNSISLCVTCSEDSKLYSRLTKNFEKNKLQLEKLLANKNSMETEIAYLENEIKKIKIELNNDIEFKKQNHNLYTKKSIEILKLEALRDEMINNVVEKSHTELSGE